MDRQSLLQDFQQRVLELLRASPAADLERNLKALVTQSFARFELVTREEFDIQRDLLRQLIDRVDALENRRPGGAGDAPVSPTLVTSPGDGPRSRQ